MNENATSLLLIKSSANKSATELAAALRALTDSWKECGLLEAFSFRTSEESISVARTSFAEAANTLSAYADVFGRYAAEAAALEENEPYSPDRLYVSCASLSSLAMAVIADTVDALGIDGGEGSPQRAAKILNDFLIKVEAFKKSTD